MLGNLLITGAGRFGGMVIQLLVTIILSRYLSPLEFGIVAMCSIFLSISEMLVDSGLGGSIIYFKDVQEIELHTVFWTNILISCLIYLLLFFSSHSISIFYNTPILENIIKVIGISIVIHSFTIIQYTLLSKELKFKIQSKIMIYSSIASSIIVLSIAYLGYGLWALVAQPISLKLCQSVFYFSLGLYKPKFLYSFTALKKHWSFGSKLLFSSFLKLLYDNVYIQVIGRYSSLKDAGYYAQAKRFNDIPTNLLMFPLDKVVFPSLLKSENPIESMKIINKWFALIITPMLLFFSLIASELTVVFLGDQWLESGWMLAFMLVGTIGAAFEVLTRCFLKSTGEINVLIKYDVKKRVINLVVIIISSYWSVFGLMVGFIINGFIGWLYNSIALAFATNFTLKEQFLPIVKIIFFSFLPYFITTYLLSFVELSFSYIFLFKVISYLFLLVGLLYLVCKEDMLFLTKKVVFYLIRK